MLSSQVTAEAKGQMFVPLKVLIAITADHPFYQVEKADGIRIAPSWDFQGPDCRDSQVCSLFYR